MVTKKLSLKSILSFMLTFVCVITCGIALTGCGKNMDRYMSVVPTDQYKMKQVIESVIPGVNYLIDEIGMYPKEKVTLEGDDKEYFERLLRLLDDVEDVKTVYHNVEL